MYITPCRCNQQNTDAGNYRSHNQVSLKCKGKNDGRGSCIFKDLKNIGTDYPEVFRDAHVVQDREKVVMILEVWIVTVVEGPMEGFWVSAKFCDLD